ncbi:LuxR family transcriptional regulator [Georgenia yuyongxinii]|uniref:LuxR family transcriptional regulator n=1 Tax=Georgenia yuyongxinii TaxID=2589797 RepID=A0A5B8C024_9MICO|nr:LuxR C-terminal-related transcriptional regulator [Georgenia yuyongxinii]QDC23838.1 LuxR family transcriptional regulator [Georgenia yuyongxinii]
MATPSEPVGNLPAETSSFVGRRRELGEAKKKFQAARLVSLVGPGGVGKTRLAVRLAGQLSRNFPDGVWFVELAEVRDRTSVASAALAALDLREHGTGDPLATLCAHVKGKRLLLVLDNCEHLTEPAAQLASKVLKAGPEVRIVATSREPLGLVEEHVVALPPLDLPSLETANLGLVRLNEAVQLFEERAAAASGDFALTDDNLPSVVELCRRLDGIPLAIELAAVRTRALTPDQICGRLGYRFSLLTGGSPAALPRHQTLQAAIEWSYALLDEQEARLLRRLSAFAGRFQIDDVEAVCLDPDSASAATDLLSSLVDKSLVVRDLAAPSPCYRLHESMREFSHLRLVDAGERDLMQNRLADHFSRRCGQLATEGRRRLLPWLSWMELEAENVRAVLDRLTLAGDPAAVHLTVSLTYFWITRATSEGARRLDRLLDGRDGEIPPVAHFARGFLAVLQNDPAVATRSLSEGIATARGEGPPALLARLLAMASIASTMSADPGAARRQLDEARAIAAGIDEVGATLMVHQASALNGVLDGDPSTVMASARPGAALSRELGDQYSLVMMLMNLGIGALQLGRTPDAEHHFLEALAIARDLDDRVAQCYLLGGLGCCAARRREPQLAARLFGAMETLREEAGATLNAGIRRALTPAMATASAALGPARFAAETTVGRSLGRAAAVQLALREQAHPPAPSAATGAAPLGRRELEVARLVAEGCTNKEIGARLFLSERTVESHVRNSLNKLGFSKRAQIAAWAAAHSS